MASLNSEQNKIYKKLVEEKVGEIIRYRNLVNALVAIYSFFDKNKSYDPYLGGKVSGKTPDIIIISKSKDQSDIIGDGVKGLANPNKKNEEETWEEFLEREDVKKYMNKILPKIETKIGKYMQDLDGISNPHDFFLLCPIDNTNAIGILEDQERLPDKAIILNFAFTQQESTYFLRVSKFKGIFSDKNLENQFKYQNGIFESMQDTSELISRNKLYIAEEEDHNAPIEWIMLVIWQYILPELANSNAKKHIIHKLSMGYLIIEISLKQIAEFIKQNFSLPAFGSDKEQIKFRTIKKAMKHISELTEVKIKADSTEENPIYSIQWKKLKTHNLVHEFVEKVHKDSFIEIAKEMEGKPSLDDQPASQKSLSEF
ncbi:hypothetical protein GF327_08870 [Candidatus Woesearchaeota archaeon]|nr:hypothetical protein [Candidatus Woesearchaeota archaeon]